MRNVIIAKLIKDLPDIKAGAILQSLVPDHWEKIWDDIPYNPYDLYYFHDDEYDSSQRLDADNMTYYFYRDLENWAKFFDFSKGEFVELSLVEALTLQELEQHAKDNSI